MVNEHVVTSDLPELQLLLTCIVERVITCVNCLA